MSNPSPEGESPRTTAEITARFPIGPELLGRLLEHVRTAVDGCLGAGLSTSGERPRSVVAVGVAEDLDALQWKLQTGPTSRAVEANEPTTSDDLARDDRYPDLAEAVSDRTDLPRTVAAVAVPGSWDDAGAIVLTVYLDHEPVPKDMLTIEQIEPVLAIATAVVEYCADEALRADQLVSMVEHRRVIQQAKGMVMAAQGGDASAAFRSLVVASQHFNVKLRDLAVATVEHVGGAPAEEPAQPAVGRSATATPPGDTAQDAARRLWAALREG